MLTQLLINILMAILWHLFLPAWGAADYLIGFLLGAVAMSLQKPAYGRRLWALVTFVLYVGWQILLSNVKLAWLVLQPKPQLSPGIIAVPLSVTSALETTVLASVITLTPGTLSIDLGKNDEGERVLYVHNLVVDNPDTFRKSIKDTFERRLLLITKGIGA